MTLMRTLNFVEGVTFVAGKGSYLYDSEGNKWLDFFTDVGTSSLGYCSIVTEKAMRHMIDYQLPLHAPNLFHWKERDEAAAMLCERTGMDSVFFCNSGTESVEAAIKLSRLASFKKGRGGRWIVSLSGGFHGRTYGALAAGDGPAYHYEGFGKMPADFLHLASISDMLSISTNDIAAFLLAPVFGNNDVIEYDIADLRALRKHSEKHGIALIFDEVQTGAGRCGSMTYAHRIGVIPDILTLGKGVAMGAPVGACLARGEYANIFTPGTHFSTFGGNPFSCVMVKTMLEWLNDRLHPINTRGEILQHALRSFPGVKNARGPGLLQAFDYDGDTIELAKRCRERKLLIGAFRKGPGPVKITPPLNIDQEELAEGLERLREALA